MERLNVILITGGTCSGKSEFTKWFHNGVVIEQDNFYKGKSRLQPNSEGNYDFDTPEAMDLAECARVVKELLDHRKTQIPLYDMLTSERKGKQEIILPIQTKFIIVEGIFAFYPPLDELADLKIFIDAPIEIRLARRMIRDITRKGKTKIEIMADFIPIERSYQKYIEPMRKEADLIIPFSYNPIQLIT
jgi:uridine kinase